MPKDSCNCGAPKDSRSKQCRQCFVDTGSNLTGRVCTVCKTYKPIDQFRTRPRKTTATRPRSTCTECEAAKTAAYRQANPDKVGEAKRKWERNNPDAVARIQLRAKARTLGLDPEMIVAHFESHSGLCDLCSRPPVAYSNLSIDHCHTTGEFRGLLCSPCNLALGLLRDDAELMRRAADYVTR
jgi:hypothetical protein